MTRPLRGVLVVTEVFDVGGLETHVTGMARALRAQGCAVHLAVGRQRRTDFPPEFTNVLPDQPFDQVATVGEIVAAVDRLVEFVRANDVDVVHAHPFLSLFPAALVAARANVPLAVTLHGPASLHVSYGLIHNQLVKAGVLRSAARVYGVSPEVLALAQRFAPATVCRLLPNGVDLERFVPAGGAPAEERWVLVSRLDEPKVEGLKDFCTKWVALGRAPVDVVGSGAAADALVEHVARLGASERFRFLGARDDLAAILPGYAGVVGMGRVTLEGAAVDRPVVLVGYDGVKGVLDEELATAARRANFSGRGLPTIGTDAFAAGLAALAADPARSALRAWVTREHDEQAIGRAHHADLATLTPAPGDVAARLDAVLRAHRDVADSYLRALPVAAALSDACAETVAPEPPEDAAPTLYALLVESRRHEAEHAAAMSAVTLRLNDALLALTAQLDESSREARDLGASVARAEAALAAQQERTRSLGNEVQQAAQHAAVQSAEREVLEIYTRQREKRRRDWEDRFSTDLERAKNSRRYRLGLVLSALVQHPVAGLARTYRWARGRYEERGWGLAEALEAWDPLADIHKAMWKPDVVALPDAPYDPVAIRLATRRAENALWDGFAWEVPGLVTVVLPVTGATERVGGAIESVLAQTYENVELLVVDDGAPDDVAARLAAWQGHPKVRVLAQSSQGRPKALSNGFRLARGEFWTWITVDDRMDPSQLERQVDALRAQPDVALVHAAHRVVDERGEPARAAVDGRAPAGRTDPTGVAGTIGAAFLYRGSVGRLLGDYAPVVGADALEYWVRVASRFPVHRLDEVLARRIVPPERSPGRGEDRYLASRVADVIAAHPVRQEYQGRPWTIFTDTVTEVRLAGVPLAPHVPVPLDTTVDVVPPYADQNVMLIHPGTLEWLARLQLPPECVVLVWFDVDEPDPFRFGAELQRIAHACLVSDSSTAERCSVFTRRVLRATTPRAALDHVSAVASNDLATYRTVPDVDGERSLPDVLPRERPLRVLLEVGHFDVGGLERVVLDLASVLRDEGCDVAIAVLGRPGRAAAEAEQEGFEVVAVPEADRDGAYRRLLAAREIDLVNAHFSTAGADAAAERGIPFVQTIHNTYVWFSPGEIAEYQRADAHTTAYVCVSPAVAGDFHRRIGVPAGKLVVIPNGIDLRRIDAARAGVDRAAERSALGWGPSDFVALCAASIGPVKSQIHVVRALGAIRQDVPQLRLAFLGDVADDQYAAGVRREIERFGLGGAVDLMGYREDPQRYYFVADAFLLPSFIEGWSLALAEALYAGLPVLATDVGAARELLAQTGGHLLRSPLGDLSTWSAPTFAHAVSREQPVFVRQLSDALRQLVRRPYPALLPQHLAESFDRRRALSAYARMFRWLADGGPVAGVRPAVWELHQAREGVRRVTRPMAVSTRQERPARAGFRPREVSGDEVVARVRGGRRPLVFLQSIEWCVWLFQRPQQLARHFARLGHPTIYDDTRCRSGFVGFREVEPDLFLFRGDPEDLARIPDPVLWTFCYNHHLRDAFPSGCPSVYDLIDDLSVHADAPELNLGNHRRALVEAAVVTYVARQLEGLLDGRRDALYLPNGVDAEHFADPTIRLPLDRRMQGILREGKPIAGYYGALAQWFDYALLARAAELRPDWSFVLIGQRYDDSLEGQAALALPNVHWLGPRDYAVLPAYLRCFDVATIPFAINQITLATSPLKLYEYFAGGKPVVTTAMPECTAFPEVAIARTPRQLAAALDGARDRGRDDAFRRRLHTIAQENSWAERVRTVAQRLDSLARTADGPASDDVAEDALRASSR